MRTAFISGITGQDGRYLARTLLKRGFRVIGSTRGDPEVARGFVESWAGGRIEMVRLDVADGNAVSSLISELHPDRVFHLAGQSSVGRSFAEPSETWQSAALSTLHFLEAVRRGSPASRCLLAGSGEAFGDTQGEPANEASPMRPRSPYAGAKAAAHHLVTTYRDAYGLFACTAIFYNHESPLRPRAFFTRKVVRSAVEIAAGVRESIELGALDVARDFGWAEEYLEAAHRMLELPDAEDFVLATGVTQPLRHFVELAFAQVGLDYRNHVRLDQSLLRKGEIPAMNADPRKAARLLDWRATVTLEELIARMIRAERSVEAGAEALG